MTEPFTVPGVAGSTQIHTHMCYFEFNDVLKAVAVVDADVISIETARSNMELLLAFRDHTRAVSRLGQLGVVSGTGLDAAVALVIPAGTFIRRWRAFPFLRRRGESSTTITSPTARSVGGGLAKTQHASCAGNRWR
ncbi:MAG: hypothetical protein GXY58_09795 [Planctomycetaceae bacterium]|nr:hypothetical protein [Planctomycetaceae bacterium]